MKETPFYFPDVPTIVIRKFLSEVGNYQSNHLGNYTRELLVISYLQLPSVLRDSLTPSKATLKRLWRGCDGLLSEKRCVSFTTNKGYAGTFGRYVIPFKEIKTHDGLIDTAKVYKLSQKHKGFDTGDDEGEVIVVAPIWTEKIINILHPPPSDKKRDYL